VIFFGLGSHLLFSGYSQTQTSGVNDAPMFHAFGTMASMAKDFGIGGPWKSNIVSFGDHFAFSAKLYFRFFRITSAQKAISAQDPYGRIQGDLRGFSGNMFQSYAGPTTL